MIKIPQYIFPVNTPQPNEFIVNYTEEFGRAYYWAIENFLNRVGISVVNCRDVTINISYLGDYGEFYYKGELFGTFSVVSHNKGEGVCFEIECKQTQ